MSATAILRYRSTFPTHTYEFIQCSGVLIKQRSTTQLTKAIRDVVYKRQFLYVCGMYLQEALFPSTIVAYLGAPSATFSLATADRACRSQDPDPSRHAIFHALFCAISRSRMCKVVMYANLYELPPYDC